jgi:hypothetical protein
VLCEMQVIRLFWHVSDWCHGLARRIALIAIKTLL